VGPKPARFSQHPPEHLKKWRRIWDSNSRYRFYPYKGLKMRPPHGSPRKCGQSAASRSSQRAQIGGRNTLQFTGFAASPMAHWMLPETHSRRALKKERWKNGQLLIFLAHLGWTSFESSGETAATQGLRRASSPSSFGSSPGGSRARLKAESTPRRDGSCGRRSEGQEWSRQDLGE